MTEWIMICYLLVICLAAAVTDWKKGKIYNRWLSFGMIPASVLVILYYYGHRESIRLFVVNLLAAGCHCHSVLCIKDVGSRRFQALDVSEFPVSGGLVCDHRQHVVPVYVDFYADLSGSLSIRVPGILMVSFFKEKRRNSVSEKKV